MQTSPFFSATPSVRLAGSLSPEKKPSKNAVDVRLNELKQDTVCFGQARPATQKAEPPRHFYHLTTSQAWRKIQHTGVLQPAFEKTTLKYLDDEQLQAHYQEKLQRGIFTWSRENFQNVWCNADIPWNPFKPGYNSPADYLVRRTMRMLLNQLNMAHDKPLLLMNAPWEKVLEGLSHYPNAEGLTLLEIQPQGPVPELATRSLGSLWAKEQTPRTVSQRFADFLDSHTQVEGADILPGAGKDHPVEYIFSSPLPVGRGVRLAKSIPIGQLLSLYRQSDDGIDNEQLKALLFEPDEQTGVHNKQSPDVHNAEAP